MHPRLLEYFNQELLYMRQCAAEFAREHPAVASHLGAAAPAIADPYVERLIEAFCLLSARTRIQLDAEFPRFSSRLLEVLQPQFLSPLPAMAVARLQPDPDRAEMATGLRLPPRTAMSTRLAGHPETEVQWRSAREVELWPLHIAEAELQRGLPAFGAAVLATAAQAGQRGAAGVRACLRLRLRALPPWRLDQLQGLHSLRVHLGGDEAIAAQVFDLLHGSFAGCVAGLPGKVDGATPLPGCSLSCQALQPGQGALPLRPGWLASHNLLLEYFHAPACLLEFTLHGLARTLAATAGSEVDLWLLLRRDPGPLGAWVDEQTFVLGCTPVVNLFEARTERLQLAAGSSECHVVADRTRPLDFEVWGVDELRGHAAADGRERVFRPLYQTLQRDGGDHRRYFSLRREPRRPSQAALRRGGRSPYVGTEVYASLVDQFDAPHPLELHQLWARAWLSNRDLPLWLAGESGAGLQLTVAAQLRDARLLRPPSPPRPPLGLDHPAWRFIRLLGLHHLPLAELGAQPAAQALRELLRLFAPAADAAAAARIEALRGARIEVRTRRLPLPGPLVHGRAVHARLEFDEGAFSPGSPLLLGMVLEQWMAQYVAINTCCSTEVHTLQRGPIWQGPLRMGGREAL